MRSFLLVLIVPVLFLAGCSNESATIRYRVTAEFEVGGEAYKGSGVREITITHTPNSLSGFKLGVSEKGEAIVVDTGPGRSAVFILSENKRSRKVFSGLFLDCFRVKRGSDTGGWIKSLETFAIGSRCSADPYDRNAPLIAAFDDESIPASIFEFSSEAFEKAHGVAATFIDMVIEVVDDNEPISVGIDKRLPWLNDIPFEGYTTSYLKPSKPGQGPLARDATLPQKVSSSFFREE